MTWVKNGFIERIAYVIWQSLHAVLTSTDEFIFTWYWQFFLLIPIERIVCMEECGFYYLKNRPLAEITTLIIHRFLCLDGQGSLTLTITITKHSRSRWIRELADNLSVFIQLWFSIHTSVFASSLFFEAVSRVARFSEDSPLIVDASNPPVFTKCWESLKFSFCCPFPPGWVGSFKCFPRFYTHFHPFHIH